MRVITLVFLVFATLSVRSSKSFAETIGADPTVNKPQSQPDLGPPQSTTPLNDMEVTQPSPDTSRPLDYFYPYQRGLSVVLGGYYQPNSPDGLYDLLGLDYLMNSLTHFHWQVGVETVSMGEGHAWIAARWNQSNSARLRTYYSLGFGVRVVPQNGIATFLQISDYFPRAAIGAEYTLKSRSSLCAGVATASDFQGNVFITLTTGYLWGF